MIGVLKPFQLCRANFSGIPKSVASAPICPLSMLVQFVNVMMMGPIIHLVVRRRINSRIIMCDLAYYENIKLCAQQQEKRSFPGNRNHILSLQVSSYFNGQV